MMKNPKTRYYSYKPTRPDSWLKLAFWQIFILFESPCRLIIEVFIRREFGERYFRLPFAVTVFMMLILWPIIQLLPTEMMLFYLSTPYAEGLMNTYMRKDYGWHFFHYFTWYVYAGLFLWACIRHYKAARHSPSVYDFARMSTSSGYIDKRFVDMAKQFGREGDARFIECWLEPLPFFLVGLMLYMLGQHLGWRLMGSAVVYSVSYQFAYWHGDSFVLDTIDDMIRNRYMAANFVDEMDPSETGGYRFLGRKPDDPEKRRAVLDHMQDDDDGIPPAT